MQFQDIFRMGLVLSFIGCSFNLKGQVQNMFRLGDSINTPYSELAPFIAPNQQTLYFIRQGDPLNTGKSNNQDIWFASKNQRGEWEKAQHLDSPLNDGLNSGILNLSADGQEALIFGDFVGEQRRGRGFSLARKVNQEWVVTQSLDIEGLDELNQGGYCGATLSNDGKVMIISLSETEENQYDLYLSFQKENQSWTYPQKLGERLNSPGGEVTPFLAADTKTLYFSSEREDSYGSYDVYVSRRLDDTWQHWSEPINLGPPVNTEASNIYYSSPAVGNKAYLSSLNPQGLDYDIYQVNLIKPLRPEPVLSVQGKVLDAQSQKPVLATIVYTQLPGRGEEARTFSNAREGSYRVLLPKKQFYEISVRARGYFPLSESIDLREKDNYQELSKILYLRPIQAGEIIQLNNIFFHYAQADLQEASYADLNRILLLLEENPQICLEIQGHADASGVQANNMRLSKERAKVCYNYLLQKGIASDRMSYRGYGSSEPLIVNSRGAGQELNRRVQFKVLECTNSK